MNTFETRKEAVEFLERLVSLKLLIPYNEFEYYQPGFISIPCNWFSRPTYVVSLNRLGAPGWCLLQKLHIVDADNPPLNFVDITLNEPNAMFGDPSIEIEVIE